MIDWSDSALGNPVDDNLGTETEEELDSCPMPGEAHPQSSMLMIKLNRIRLSDPFGLNGRDYLIRFARHARVRGNLRWLDPAANSVLLCNKSLVRDSEYKVGAGATATTSRKRHRLTFKSFGATKP